MACVHRILLMDLRQLSLLVVNLLVKADRSFIGIDLFDIASLPSRSSLHLIEVSTASIG
jgi:hypothetical protein